MPPARPKPASRTASLPIAQLDRGVLDHTLGFRLRGAWNYMDHYFNKHLGAEGITPQLYAILIVLERNPGCRISDLCRTIAISPNNIGAPLDFLLDRGLVFRDFSSEDRRTKRLGLTELGQDYLGKLHRLHQPVSDHFLAKLGENDMAKLVELLAKLSDTDG